MPSTSAPCTTSGDRLKALDLLRARRDTLHSRKLAASTSRRSGERGRARGGAHVPPVAHAEVVRARRHAEGDRRRRRATHVFAGAPGPNVTMRLTDRSLYRKLFFNPELHAGEAYMDGRLSFEDSTLRDFLTLFSVNRLSLGTYPLQKVLRRISRGLKRFQQANPVGKAQRTSRTTTTSATTSTSCSSTRACSTPAPTSSTTATASRQAQRNKLRLIAAKLNLKPGLRDPRHRQRLGRPRALPGGAWRTSTSPASRCRRSSTRCPTRRRGAPGSPTGCASSCRTTASVDEPLRPHRLGRHVRARRRRTTTASSSPRSTS